MEEQAAQVVAGQSELISILLGILNAMGGIAIVVIGRIIWLFYISINKNKDTLSEYKQEVAADKLVIEKEFTTYKADQAQIIAGLRSDLRSNTESDTNISKTLEEFKTWFSEMREIMGKLVVDVEILINKK